MDLFNFFRMLNDIFGVKVEKRSSPAVSCLGRGYDLIHDEIKARNIFDFSQNEFCEAEYGIQVQLIITTLLSLSWLYIFDAASPQLTEK